MDVSVGTAWRRAWAETPPEVRENRTLTSSDGLPSSRMRKTVVGAVLGTELVSSVAFRSAEAQVNKMVPRTIQDQLAQRVRDRSADLARIAELFDLFVAVIEELALSGPPSAALKRLRVGAGRRRRVE
ncbi:MAG TPA: hypothetical protein PKE40_01275 [Arachnia sp.]|nr:hypothetical protein [Arachnia sp.]HMT84959.1 hypothetical protein [Arachnia sp.]